MTESVIQSTLVTTTVFVAYLCDVKLNCCCNESKFRVILHFCATSTDVIKSVIIKRVHCICNVLEDELHFVLECSMFAELRQNIYFYILLEQT